MGENIADNFDSKKYDKIEKSRIENFDLIRCVSTIIIVTFHFNDTFITHSIDGYHNLFYLFPNGDWGGTIVTIFFMLSGASLFYNYNARLDLKHFYFKRWKYIFPIFYLAWFSCYLITSFIYENLFWGVQPITLLLTLFGLDGYFLYLIPNYYIVGEWFLGAIILLYLIFPLLRILMLRHIACTSIVLLALYATNLNVHLFKILDFRNIITCVCSFYMGMIVVRYKDRLTNKFSLLISSVVAMFILFVGSDKIGLNYIVSVNVLGIALFVIMMNSPECVMNNHVIKVFISSISKYSYAIFLIHHVIIYIIMNNFAGQTLNVPSVFIILSVIYITVFAAAVALYWANTLITTHSGKVLEKYIIY